MTTKDALDLAISIMKKQATSTELTEAIALLQHLRKRDLVANWSKESIVAALDDWKEQHGRPPAVTNLIEPGMPGANIIQKHFGMRASAFIRERYPIDNDLVPPINRYGYKNCDDWISCFREQFMKHCNEDGFSSKTYNMLKDKNTPLWMTIARHCGTTKWTKLTELAGVNCPTQSEQDASAALHVSVKSPLLERFEAAVAKREELDCKLIDTIEKSDKRRRSKKYE